LEKHFYQIPEINIPDRKIQPSQKEPLIEFPQAWTPVWI
jgi:hypothetical protein